MGLGISPGLGIVGVSPWLNSARLVHPVWSTVRAGGGAGREGWRAAGAQPLECAHALLLQHGRLRAISYQDFHTVVLSFDDVSRDRP